MAAMVHTDLANLGIESKMVVGHVEGRANNLNQASQGGRHAWVEFMDLKTGQWMVSDPVAGVVMPRDEAYQSLYGGVSDLTQHQFVKPK